MKLRHIFTILPATLALGFGMQSCVNDLDVTPKDPNTVMEFDDDAVFNKIYGTLGLTGQQGANGDGDVDDIDEGTSAFYRMTWCANELVTDEAILTGWNDAGIPTLTAYDWDANNDITKGAYYRLTFDVTLCNYYLEQTDGATAESKKRRAEVRFLRALNYYYLMDLYGNPPFTTTVSTELPKQIKRADLFAWLETELKECSEDMDAPVPNVKTYGRANKAAAWLLLSRMYLNAEVYTGVAQYEKAAAYADSVITKSGYSLCPTYSHLFMADNGGEYDGSSVNKAPQEVILPILQDGKTTRSWGGSLFLIAGTHKSDMTPYGTTDEWKGPRACESLVAKFFPNTANAPLADESTMCLRANDERALFWGKDRSVSTGKNTDFTQGFSVAKFTNVRLDGGQTADAEFTDTDIPLLRLAEAYLTRAEALTRIAGGVVTADAAKDINVIRGRAGADEKSNYTLSDICDEWSREFFFEGRRRIDLVRFNRFGGQSEYNWDWKGGKMGGTQFEAWRNIYAIPATDLNVNSANLTQNAGY